LAQRKYKFSGEGCSERDHVADKRGDFHRRYPFNIVSIFGHFKSSEQPLRAVNLLRIYPIV
jgi:hypothetical protein